MTGPPGTRRRLGALSLSEAMTNLSEYAEAMCPLDQQGLLRVLERVSGTLAAADDGLPAVLHHGTFQLFSRFAVTKDLGYHFGTYPAAERRLRRAPGRSSAFLSPRIIGACLLVNNPVVLDLDPGGWHIQHLCHALKPSLGAEAIVRILNSFNERVAWKVAFEQELLDRTKSRIGKAECNGRSEIEKSTKSPAELASMTARRLVRDRMSEIEANDPDRCGYEDIRSALISAGYDGIVYRNRYEATNEQSWVVFSPDQVVEIGQNIPVDRLVASTEKPFSLGLQTAVNPFLPLPPFCADPDLLAPRKKDKAAIKRALRALLDDIGAQAIETKNDYRSARQPVSFLIFKGRGSVLVDMDHLDRSWKVKVHPVLDGLPAKECPSIAVEWAPRESGNSFAPRVISAVEVAMLRSDTAGFAGITCPASLPPEVMTTRCQDDRGLIVLTDAPGQLAGGNMSVYVDRQSAVNTNEYGSGASFALLRNELANLPPDIDMMVRNIRIRPEITATRSFGDSSTSYVVVCSKPLSIPNSLDINTPPSLARIADAVCRYTGESPKILASRWSSEANDAMLSAYPEAEWSCRRQNGKFFFQMRDNDGFMTRAVTMRAVALQTSVSNTLRAHGFDSISWIASDGRCSAPVWVTLDRDSAIKIGKNLYQTRLNGSELLHRFRQGANLQNDVGPEKLHKKRNTRILSPS